MSSAFLIAFGLALATPGPVYPGPILTIVSNEMLGCDCIVPPSVELRETDRGGAELKPEAAPFPEDEDSDDDDDLDEI